MSDLTEMFDKAKETILIRLKQELVGADEELQAYVLPKLEQISQDGAYWAQKAILGGDEEEAKKMLLLTKANLEALAAYTFNRGRKHLASFFQSIAIEFIRGLAIGLGLAMKNAILKI